MTFASAPSRSKTDGRSLADHLRAKGYLPASPEMPPR